MLRLRPRPILPGKRGPFFWPPEALARGAGLLLLFAVGAHAVACASASDAETHGGQTGSLVPDCLGGDGTANVVMGDVALGSSFELERAAVRNAAGVVIAVDLEYDSDSAGTVIRTQQALTPGTYVVSAACEVGESERTLVVAEAAPLPTALGDFSVPQQPQACSDAVLLHWTPSAAIRAYLTLVELRARFDQGEEFVWQGFGQLSPSSEPLLELALPRCSTTNVTGCVPRGTSDSPLTLHISGRIAGEEATLAATPLPLAGSCLSPEPAEPGLCGVAPGYQPPGGGSRRSGLGLGCLGLAWLAMGLRRRRRAK